MKKIFASLFILLALISSAFGAINPNQIQGYQTVFTGKNTVVNGGIEISQLLGAASSIPATASYPVDNVQITTSTASVFQTVQVNSTNVATYATGYLASLGATNALQTSVNATHGAPAATDEFALYFPIEGLNFARFQYGTTNAKAASLQFKVRCSVSGTYSGAIKNYANTRAYPFSFACISGGDRQFYIQNIPGDTGGTWVGNTNTGAAYITFDLGSGANFLSTASAWQTGNYNGVTGQTALSAQVNGSLLTITDVQFEVGTFSTQFDRKMYQQILAECQRYLPYFSWGASGESVVSGTMFLTTEFHGNVWYKVPTRIAPTGIIVSAVNIFNIYVGGGLVGATSAIAAGAYGIDSVEIYATTAATTIGYGGFARSGGAGFIYLTGARI